MASPGEAAPLPSAPHPDQEAALIQLVLAGETERFYQLVRPHERSVYLAAFAILQNAADAEEVAQEAMLKAFRHLGSFRAESRFSTWLVRITMNEARTRLRHERRVQYQSLEATVPEEDNGEYCPIAFADWREVPSEVVEREEVRETIRKALEKLPDKQREVLVLRDIEQLNIAETAVVLGISPAAVKVRLLRARLRMRDLLAPHLRALYIASSAFRKGKNPWL